MIKGKRLLPNVKTFFNIHLDNNPKLYAKLDVKAKNYVKK